ncbi:hypothetical protein [Streptomyces sp. RFCAC02]|uniref:hypothetical protein n=1 Tax=Streptomyces sp. RFCAC02 TaxID=2499143 RepID=UPI00101FC974|nr:hypothetical protein [Streptomyces sp. RFCAC02]
MSTAAAAPLGAPVSRPSTASAHGARKPRGPVTGALHALRVLAGTAVEIVVLGRVDAPGPALVHRRP